MKTPDEVIKPIWDKYSHSNDVSTKELVVQIWNAAIEYSAHLPNRSIKNLKIGKK